MVKTFNLFKTESTDPSIVRREQHITRLYVCLLSVSFSILAIYIGTFETEIKYTVKNPSESDYLALYGKYRNTLNCPCTAETLYYANFTYINTTYHQICSSGFVSSQFITQLFSFSTVFTYHRDFMAMSGLLFLHIAQSCASVHDSVTEKFYGSLNNNFGAYALMSPNDLEQKITGDFDTYRNISEAYIIRGLQETLETSAFSHIISIAQTNFNLEIVSNDTVELVGNDYSNCSCAINPDTCSMDGAFYEYDSNKSEWLTTYKVMGIRLGCMPLYSSLLSTFACWYSVECYQQVPSNRTVLKAYLI